VSIQKRRSRIVSFRLSDEEYDSLKNVSATCGARSVSEYTRSVACQADAAEFGKLDSAVANLNEAIQALDYYIQRLSEIVEDPEENKDAKL
jgi:predicted DNA-binding protein